MNKRNGKIGDFLQLGANAFVSGLVAAIVLSVVTLLLASSAQAAALNDAQDESIVVSGMRSNQPWSVALTPTAGDGAPGVGALWASAEIATLTDELTRGADFAAIPQTDTAATLQLLLGLIALATAGIVAVIGRTVPARRVANLS